MSKRPIPVRVTADMAGYSQAAFDAALTGHRPVAESAPASTLERVAATEAPTILGARQSQPGHLPIRLIKAGWSLNGNFYAAEVLKRDGPTAWPKGSLCYIDHATEEEDEQRPAGSIKNLAAVLTEDARWSDAENGLVAEVRLFSLWREAIEDMKDTIGMSIRAWVYGEPGEAEGRQGFIVSGIPEGRSVDFVTTPAAGGAILSVLESVQRQRADEARSIGVWLESRLHLALTGLADNMYGDGRLTREERITLSAAIGDGLTAYTARVEADAPQLYQRDLWAEPGDGEQPAAEGRRAREAPVEQVRAALQAAVQKAHGGADTYVWVRDFDPDQQVVWFDVSTSDGTTTWQQSYTGDSGQVALSGDRTQVTPRVVYDPVPAGEAASASPAGRAAETATESAPASAGETTPAPPAPPDQRKEPHMGANTGGEPGTQAGTSTSPADETTTTTVASTDVSEARIAELIKAGIAEATGPLTERLESTQAALSAEQATNRRLRAQDVARRAVSAALEGPSVPEHLRPDVTVPVTDQVLADVPLTDAGEVDTTALGERISTVIEAEVGRVAALLERHGVGAPRGVGPAARAEAVDADKFEEGLSGLFGRLGMTEAAAAVAAKGRGH